jgi:hypothetical protein
MVEMGHGANFLHMAPQFHVYNMFQCLVVLSFSKKDPVGKGQVSGPLTSDSQNI